MSALQAAQIVGSWLLLEWRIDYSGRSEPAWPFGKDAAGLLVYAADGWMSATMSRRERTLLTATSAQKSDDASTARAFREYLAYSGRWHLHGAVIVHDVEIALNPVLMGTEQLREARFEGAELVLGAAEPLAGGAVRQHRIRWRRP